MTDRPLIVLGSPQPITPPSGRRGGQLEHLLAQFDTQRSGESATRSRRETTTVTSGKRKRDPRQLPPPAFALPTAPTTPPASAAPQMDTSEDELAHSIRRVKKQIDELKMERRRKETERSTRRRSTRHSILESDTLPTTSKPTAPLLPPKPVTARNRLRNDIARNTKTRASNFLVANKDYFLPLLPPANHVAKLAARHPAEPIIEYEELSEQPAGVTAVMKPYQLSGLSFLVHLYNNGFSGILGDEMGLGKTLQTLSLFQYLEELDQKHGVTSEELRPYLVICPLSVLNSWVTEAERWVPGLKVMRFHGAAAERQRLKRVAVGMEDMKGHETSRARNRKGSQKAGRKLTDSHDESPKIIVTTYDTFQAEHAWFKHSFVWRYVVLDEGHKIKSSVTQISMALRNISTEYRLILTGTPLQNNLVEMWSLLAWLYPNVFINGTETLFKESFDLNKGKVNKTTMDDARRLLELIMLRRMKDSPSVNLGLPPKEEILLYVPLTPLQKFWYTRILTRMDNALLSELFLDGKSKAKAALEQERQEDEHLQRVEQKSSLADHEWEEIVNIMRETIAKEQGSTENKGAWQKLMNLVMQLRKCCSHPYLLPGAAPEPYYFSNHIIQASGKFILLEKLLKHTIFGEGKKVLIFSGFTRTLDYCEDLLSLISDHGQLFKSLRLDGSTARARRNLDIRLFNQEGSDYKVMLLSTRAGGLGINLTSAQDVIFLDEDWNPQITLQAEARAHRIGQTKKVTIYKLCTQGTVEEQMMGRIRKKLYLSAKITESMRNIHEEQSSKKTKPGRARSSETGDMPQMDTSQLMTLVRRGAQTLSHPEIDVKEMVSWDLDTMMAQCRDKPADPLDPNTSHSAVDEDKWLSVMERVECAVFEGKRYERQRKDNHKSKTSTANILPDSISREDRRKGKNTTVMVDGYAITKESLNCADWEAVPTMAGKDPRLAEPVRDKRREFNHEEHCLQCFEGPDVGHMVACRSCPRAYHFDCIGPDYQAKVKGFSGFYCAQHHCCDCGKNTSDAGGLIFRCRWCPQGFCEDCLDWEQTELVGENLPELEVRGEAPTQGGFYIKCPTCIEACKESKEQKEWVQEMEKNYKEDHDVWRESREQEQREVEQREATDTKLQEFITQEEAIAEKVLEPEMAKGTPHTSPKVVDLPQLPQIIVPHIQQQTYAALEDDEEALSPPALTDTSVATPAFSCSRVGTPNPAELLLPAKKAKKRVEPDGEPGESRAEKRARLDAQVWTVNDDPLLNALGFD